VKQQGYETALHTYQGQLGRRSAWHVKLTQADSVGTSAGPHQGRPNIAKMFPTANREAADLLQKLLVFDPEKRYTAADALRHPYVANFHDPANEPRCTRAITIPINDNEKVRMKRTCCLAARAISQHGWSCWRCSLLMCRDDAVLMCSRLVQCSQDARH
jgi:serine/threonine protein kinase